jgi:hypothetical protein
MVGPQQISFGGDVLVFICQEHSIFTLIVHRVFSFSATAFGFCFRLDLHSGLVIFVHRGVFFASDLYWYSLKEVSLKISNGVGKEKKLCAKLWYKKELV